MDWSVRDWARRIVGRSKKRGDMTYKGVALVRITVASAPHFIGEVLLNTTVYTPLHNTARGVPPSTSAAVICIRVKNWYILRHRVYSPVQGLLGYAQGCRPFHI